jgi:hypothetical protein
VNTCLCNPLPAASKALPGLLMKNEKKKKKKFSLKLNQERIEADLIKRLVL